MADGDDLDFNPFFQALQTTFKQQYSIARHKCHLVCIPATDTLQGRTINQRFALVRLDRNITEFTNNYMIVTGYLDHAVQKLQGICQQATEDILKLCKRERQIDSIAQAVESYVVGSVHTKMWQAVCQQCKKEESLLQKKLEELRGVTAEQLGVKEAFCCPLPGAVVELATLDGLKTPLEKLSCLKRTLDSVNEEVNAHLRENQDPTSDDLPCLVSDDLILLLVPVLVQARCLHLPSNVFYIENLQWSLSSKDDLGFSLVTFKASLEYMMSADFSQLRATMSPTQKNNELAAAPMPLKSITGETGDQQRAGGKRGEQVPDVIPLRKADKSGLG
ncbi:hypothetical protein Bbelb_194820 [Branchiostoma belcheri]|nr:hypothetical protein Bbelb_194820 [Branchiostoma belcheri]